MSVRWVYAVLLCYAAGFLLFPPRVLLIIDEFGYVSQALAFARGALTIPGADPLFPPNPLRVASNFPPGTSLLQAPLVAIAGWRAAAALSVLSLVAATLITAKWLRENEYDAGFAILIPAFFGALFFGRVAMSDVPSAAIVALSLWLLWRAERHDWRWSLLAGLAAGLSFLLREPNVVLLAPLFLGAILRRKCVVWALLAGGFLGLALRAAISHEIFGSAIYVRDSGYGFSLQSAGVNLPQYAVILGIMFPLGIALPFFYRGARRFEVIAAFAAYTALFLFYEYDSARDNGPLKGLILSSRFMVPALPLMALMAANVWPRWAAGLPPSVTARLLRIRVAGFVALGAASFAIHPVLRRLERTPLSIVTAIQSHTSPEVPVITNHHATLKYLSPVYGVRRTIQRSSVTAADVPRFFRLQGKLSIVFLDRTDSEMFRADANENAQLLSDLQQRCALEPVYDAEHSSWARLRVFTVIQCG